MNEMDYSSFKLFAASWENKGKYEPMITAIDKFIDTEKMDVFYPKNFAVEDEYLEIHFFDNNKVIIFSEREKNVEIKILRYDQIQSVEMLYRDVYEPLTLTIEFSNDEVIELNDKSDTNNAWRDRFTVKIEQIFKLLS